MVDMLDFDEAIDRLIAGLEKKRVMNQKEREIIAYHESGHAIVATALPRLLTDPDREKATRAMNEMMGMKKLDIAELERAAAGGEMAA